MGRPKTVDDVIDFILANAPAEGEEVKKNPFKGRRFEYELVDGAVEQLHREKRFLDLEPYDLSGTLSIWHTREGITNFELARKATKKLLKTLQAQQPSKTLEQILPTIIAEHCQKTPINRYQTTLMGMMVSIYDNSPYHALKDLINNDAELTEFKDFQPYDMQMSPRETWVNKDGTINHTMARKATRQLIQKLQEQNSGKTLEEILPIITYDHFIHTPINRYKTTLSGMLQGIYELSPFEALKDIIDNDGEFAEFKDFQPYDMKTAPQNTWKKKEGTKNYELARQATKQLIKKLQEQNPDKTLEEILPTITQDHFYHTPINRYQTTLRGMIANVYNCSPHDALKDLIDNDSAFAEFKDFQPYDMFQAPKETWVNKDGTLNHTIARKATKQLIKKLQEQDPSKTLQEILPTITQDHFYHTPINRYQTTLTGMLSHTYDYSPYRALKDLAENDEELRPMLPFIENMRRRTA